jgi:hypothetical protein
VVVLGIAPIAVFLLIFVAVKRPQELLTTLGIVAGGLLAAWLVMFGFGWLIASIWQVKISPEGIRCTNYWGRIAFVQWSSITGVRAQNLYGIPYLVYTSTERRTEGWLPLNLIGMEECIDLIIDYAGKENPMTEWFLDAEKKLEEALSAGSPDDAGPRDRSW